MFIPEAYAETSDVIEVQEAEIIPVESSNSFQSGLMSLAPMILIFAVFYFLLIRPQEKKRRQKEILVSGVNVGEKVLTNSGIFGTVTKINQSDNTIELEIAPNVNVKVLKSAILEIISREKSTNTTKKIENKDKKVKGAKSS